MALLPSFTSLKQTTLIDIDMLFLVLMLSVLLCKHVSSEQALINFAVLAEINLFKKLWMIFENADNGETTFLNIGPRPCL